LFQGTKKKVRCYDTYSVTRDGQCTYQKDLRAIWGFVCAAEYEIVELPTARLMQCSRSSRRDASSLAAASLKAEGLIVANDKSCATVCEVTNALAG
jgi:hypothetical protein